MTDHDSTAGRGDPDELVALGPPDLTRSPNGANRGEVERVPLTSPEDLVGADRRSELTDLANIPALDPVGYVDASTDASTQKAFLLVAETVDLPLDSFVVTAQRLVDGTALFHYGIVTEVSSRVDGAEAATDTALFAALILPGERYRRAEVAWIRTWPERYLPPISGSPVWVAAGEHRRRATFLDQMAEGEQIPIGIDMNHEVVYAPYSFLNGDRGGHVSISGKSGVATKTSYALFLLYMLFEGPDGLRARTRTGTADADCAVIFSVKGADLCVIDQPNSVYLAQDSDLTRDSAAMWERLGLTEPTPFGSVAVYAPAEDTRDGEVVADIAVRDRRSTQAYGWTPAAFIRRGLLEYAFDDLDSGQLSFIEQVTRTRLLQWAWPIDGDNSGRVVLIDPAELPARDQGGATWESAARHWDTHKAANPQPAGHGVVVDDLDQLVAYIAGKVLEGEPGFDPNWTGSVTQSTQQAFVRRLWKATPRLRRLVRRNVAPPSPRPGDAAGAGGDRVNDGPVPQIHVVDVHALHADAQRFVVASVLADVWAAHEHSTARGKTFIVLDELNKYAPKAGRSPIGALLVDIAARGRSLGVLLLGAQQNPSSVHDDIINNAALEVVGQIKASESAGLGFLPPDMRARAQILTPGTMITNQPLIPVPVPVRFPFPPYATRFDEVAARAADIDDAQDLMEHM